MNLLESQWLGQHLAAIPDSDLFPLLNVGSSTLEFRTRTQPYIDVNVFAPLRARGGAVYHADLKAAPGVDLVGDLVDPGFQNRLADLRPRSVLCSNLLEHVTDPRAVCDALLQLLPVGGYLVVSGPHDYPYHADPIDTMFRPTIREAAALFPGTALIDSAIIDSGNWRQWNVAERGRPLGRALVRMLVPVYRPRKWPELVRQSPYIFKHIKAFAVILQKVAS
jgi:hypothetical protein